MSAAITALRQPRIVRAALAFGMSVEWWDIATNPPVRDSPWKWACAIALTILVANEGRMYFRSKQTGRGLRKA